MAVDYFLKLEGVTGEAIDTEHAGTIEVISWSWGATQQGSSSFGSGGTAGKVSMQDMNFTMRVCKASPILAQRCADGKHIPKAELFCRKSAGDAKVEYLKYTFTDVIVTSYQTGGSNGGEEIPVESISLGFTSAEMDYKPQNADGSPGEAVHFGWDTKKNEKK